MRLAFSCLASGDGEIRTLDPLLARQVLSQLSYTPTIIWHSPALPCRLQHSTIGRSGLNHRVRDGYGCVPEAHRHRNFRVTDSKCRKYFIRLWKACFPKVLWNIFYKRRSRDRGTLFRGALTLDNSTVKHWLLLLLP